MPLASLQLGNTAGVAWNIARALESERCSTIVVELEPEQGDFPCDLRLHLYHETPSIARVVHFAHIAKLSRAADVVHFHFGIRPFARYLRRLCNAPFFVHYHGSDLREGISDALRNLAVCEFVATPDLRRWAPSAIWVPNPYPLPRLVRKANSGQPIVGHFPSTPSKKGTAFITGKVREMQRSLDFEYRLVSGVTQREAVQLMAGCDIVIDQLTEYGAYGMVSVEAMALGCVVLSSVNPELFDRCPVIPVSSKSFEERLSEILVARHQWSELGNRGREYVGRVHNPSAVARRILDEYAKYVS
ncbi:MAG TPA: hypothetical protein VGA48_08135 [Thermoplasmata archaeon]